MSPCPWDADEQENSLENQIRHYETVIKANPAYEYAGVYSDFAISVRKEKRPGLQKMLADAQKGKIDLILTKSVSRLQETPQSFWKLHES